MHFGLKLFKLVSISANAVIFLISLVVNIFLIVKITGNESTISSALDLANIPDLPIPNIVSGLMKFAIFGCTAMMAISFCGGFGAIYEKKVLLKIYSLVIFAITTLKFIALVCFIIGKDKLYTVLNDALFHFVANSYDGDIASTNAFSRLWDAVQVGLKCCALNDPSDFAFAALPASCCHTASGASTDLSVILAQPASAFVNCAQAPDDTNSNINTPCKAVIERKLDQASNVLILLNFVTIVVLIVMIFGSLMLVQKI